MKCERLSASGANTYEACPRRYKERYENGISSGNTSQTSGGTLAHSALECYYKPGSTLTPEEAFQKAVTTVGVCDMGAMADAREMSVSEATEHPRETVDVIGVETSFKMGFPSGAMAVGFIDRIDACPDMGIKIVDYKTGAFMPDRSELRSSHQTKLYLLWARRQFPDMKHFVMEYKYLRMGMTVEIEVDHDDLDEYSTYFEALFHHVKNDKKGLPTANQFCWNCPVRGDCVEYSSVISVARQCAGSICDDESDIDQVADAYAKISNAIKALDKEKKILGSMLSAEMSHKGVNNMKAGESVIKLSRMNRNGCDSVDLAKIVAENGLVSEALRTLDLSKVKKIISGNRRAMDALKAATYQSQTAPFIMVSSKKGKK